MSKPFLKALTVRFIKAYKTGQNNIYHKQTVKLNLLVLVSFMSYKALLGKVTNILFCRVIVFFQLLIQNKINCISYLQSLQLAAAVMPNSPLLAKHKQTLPKDVLDAITTIKTSLQMILMQFYITATVKRSSHYSKKLLAVLAQLLVLLMLNQMSRFHLNVW